MTGCGHRYAIIALMLLLVTHSAVYANTGLKAADVEKFKYECWSNDAYDLEFRFSPVKKLPEASRAEGQWSYEYVTQDRQYPGNRISLPASGAVRVDLVMQLKKSNSGIGENYLWNVIVAPAVNGWRYGGHWPSKKLITEYRRLKNKRKSLIDMATLSAQDDQPVHTRIPPQDIDSAGTLNNAWEDIFGKKIVSRLVYPGSKGAESDQTGYSSTFYYVPTPALRYINDDDYKWPSFKHIDKEGRVFGFVLTPGGDCLASTVIDIVRN
jgi:hypothetical protein